LNVWNDWNLWNVWNWLRFYVSAALERLERAAILSEQRLAGEAMSAIRAHTKGKMKSDDYANASLLMTFHLSSMAMEYVLPLFRGSDLSEDEKLM